MMGSPARGTPWVVAQFALIAVVAASWLVGPPAGGVGPAGLVLAVAGGAVVLWAARAMGRSLTPFPRPVEHGTLIETGPFRYVRHPTYSGGIVCLAGISLGTSPLGLVGTAALAVLWWFKAGFEERLLLERYPGYGAYMRRVPGRIIPRRRGRAGAVE